MAANPAKVVIIKADDFKGPSSAWNSFLQVSRAAGIKVSIGVIVTGINGNASDSQWMRAQEAQGDVEFWDHGWDHGKWTNNGVTVTEFGGSGLAYQQTHLAMAQAGLKTALGHDVIAFGTPFNSFDANTATVINATTALRLFFSNSSLTRLLDARVSVLGIISESDGVSLPNAAKFKAAYPGGPPGPVSLQFHPAGFDAAHRGEYQKIVQYLQTNGYAFQLPSEFLSLDNAYYYSGASATKTWDPTSAVWGTASGGPYTTTWKAGADAYFEGTAATVTGTAASVHSITFDVTGYNLSTTTITLTGTGNTIGGTGTATISGVIAGVGKGFTKTTGSTLVLSGANTYTGNTTISAGTLALSGSGSISNTPLITVNGTLDVSGIINDPWTLNSGQQLTGAGTVNGNVTLADSATATVQPGGAATAGTLTFGGNLTVGAGAAMTFDCSSSAGSGNDQVVLTNAPATLTCNGAVLTINQLAGVNTLAPTNYLLFNLTGGSGSVSGSFNSTPNWLPSAPAAAASYSIVTVGSQVFLNYAAPGANVPTLETAADVSGGVVTLTWPASHLGWFAQSNSLDMSKSNDWFDIANSQSGTNLVIPMNPAMPNVFYRLRHP